MIRYLFCALGVAAIVSCSTVHAEEEGSQVVKVQEPTKLNAVYLVDSLGALHPLEAATFQSKASAKLLGGAKVTTELRGAQSDVRCSTGTNLAFVVQLANGVDPGTWVLYSLESKKKKREVILSTSTSMGLGEKAGTGSVPYDVVKYGLSSYKYTPSDPLPPGEYAFGRPGFGDAFAFGVNGASVK